MLAASDAIFFTTNPLFTLAVLFSLLGIDIPLKKTDLNRSSGTWELSRRILIGDMSHTLHYINKSNKLKVALACVLACFIVLYVLMNLAEEKDHNQLMVAHVNLKVSKTCTIYNMEV